MDAARKALARGPETHDRFVSWEFTRQPQWRPEPGDDEDDERQRLGIPDHILERRIDEAVAARYRRELDTITKRLEADCRRLVALVEVAHPPKTDQQVKLCRSCARAKIDEETADGRYKLACRFCGDWHGAHGDWPPVAVLRWRRDHPGKSVPVHVVEAAS
jgi:hypothetical protein